jgi:hypothetical protein
MSTTTIFKTITKQELNDIYAEHAEKVRLQEIKQIAQELEHIRLEVLRINNSGKKTYVEKRYSCSESYITKLVDAIKSLFVDSVVTTEVIHTLNKGNETLSQAKMIQITIDWTL